MLKNISVADYMSKHMITLTEDTNVKEAIKLMLDHKITSAPVMDQRGHLVGIFSEIDGMQVLLESIYDQGMSGKVGDYMADASIKINSDSNIVDVAEKFLGTAIRSFPVFDGDEFLGMISRVDLLKAFISLE